MQYRYADSLEPAEWFFRGDRNGGITAVVRRIVLGGYQKQTWFRVVTYAPASADRELVGWCRTLEDAAHVASDYSNALDSWHQAHANRDKHLWNSPPPAPEMVRAYRDAQAANARRPATR
jgi:hypothetical protein